MRQPGVSDFGVHEVDLLKVDQPTQMHQSSVGDIRTTKFEPSELGQPTNLFQPFVGDSCVCDVEFLQVRSDLPDKPSLHP